MSNSIGDLVLDLLPDNCRSEELFRARSVTSLTNELLWKSLSEIPICGGGYSFVYITTPGRSALCCLIRRGDYDISFLCFSCISLASYNSLFTLGSFEV